MSENTKREPVQELTDEQLDQAAGGRDPGFAKVDHPAESIYYCYDCKKNFSASQARCTECKGTNVKPV